MEDKEKEDMGVKMRPVRVRSIKDASLLLSRVLMQLQKDEISENKARSISYVCNSYVKAFELSEIQSRLDDLEIKVNEINGGGGTSDHSRAIE